MKPTKNGATVKEQLEQIEKQLGRRPTQLEPPCEFPSGLLHVWEAFLSLNDSRTMGQATANPISYVEMKCFVDLTSTILSSRDVAVIKDLDKIYLGIMNSNG